ncbi:HAD-IC family P-type ATPase [Tessaracoccus oleiagri]|uniref:Cation-transporting ATPase E n=1 Tax=Tessaracoccus oleiagri TaxID=686624 RepID=A0A1G9L0J1_9ACTN|nr:HAD-IC family P-type ATPase [Tessaracoccus oleiagri]SDL55508.1 cation-transporting ATPase E [Tessaracoccus oleiagri]
MPPPAPLTGLTADEVAERIQRGDVNTLPPRSGRTTWGIIRANVVTRVNFILFVLFLFVLSTGQLLQGLFAGLIVANSIIGIIQELRAKRTLDKLAVVGEARPTVLRDGEEYELARDEVVLDDVVLMRPGEQVVVDGEVVRADYLEVDESLLTGEADPVAKQPGDPVMSGSFIVAGSGAYRATKVGAAAYAAQITAQAAKFTLVHSELRQGINQILRYVSWLLVPVGILSIAVQFSRPDVTWQDAVLAMTASLVPMVPEGLVLLTAMAFALGVIRLGRRNVLVQELPAIEGLARVDVVAADKTGTLTQNAMTLGEILPIGRDEAAVRSVLEQLVAADDTHNASMRAIADAVPPATEPWPRTARAPFSSARRWSGTSFGDEHYVLGAPEALTDGEVARRAQEIAATGRRVLVLGRAELPVDSPGAPGLVAPIALLVLDQLVRPDAADTLRYFRSQGVDLKVISGDNAASVGAVTRLLGVDVGDPVDARTLPGPGREFTQTVNSADVFGRVTPEQKRHMVHALQEEGHTVAMTGDGVNDVLALKDADLGVAMGSGSPATRGVAQLVLLDDKFATLPHVVAEGRRVIGNIERVANLFLTKTIYAVALALVFGLVAVPFPFLPLHVTVVGWFTIGIPAFLLSLAPNRDKARPGFVRRTLSWAVPAGLIVAIATIVTYLVTRGLAHDVSDAVQEASSTAALIALIMVATWTLAVVARPYYLWRLALVAFAYSFYAAMFLLPFSREILQLNIDDPDRIVVGIVCGLAGMAAIEVTWWVRARILHLPARVLPRRS